MSTRTPLLGALRMCFRDARVADARGVSVEALPEVRAVHAQLARHRGVSRRQFLTTAGAATAAIVPRVALASKAPTIVIVGGGIAGLNCALELADVG